MDESLREDLNRAFHSTAKAEAVRIRLSKEAERAMKKVFYEGNGNIHTLKDNLNSVYGITSNDIRKSEYKKVIGRCIIINSKTAENLLRIRYHNIAHLVSSIFPYTDMIPQVEFTLELLYEYSGAVSLLLDLEVISDDIAELYFEFCGELEDELINTRCGMFDMGYGILI